MIQKFEISTMSQGLFFKINTQIFILIFSLGFSVSYASDSAAPDPLSPNMFARIGANIQMNLDELRSAHRKALLTYHPDKGFSDGAEIRNINEAWEILKDDDKRKKYISNGGYVGVSNDELHAYVRAEERKSVAQFYEHLKKMSEAAESLKGQPENYKKWFLFEFSSLQPESLYFKVLRLSRSQHLDQSLKKTMVVDYFACLEKMAPDFLRNDVLGVDLNLVIHRTAEPWHGVSNSSAPVVARDLLPGVVPPKAMVISEKDLRELYWGLRYHIYKTVRENFSIHSRYRMIEGLFFEDHKNVMWNLRETFHFLVDDPGLRASVSDDPGKYKFVSEYLFPLDKRGVAKCQASEKSCLLIGQILLGDAVKGIRLRMSTIVKDHNWREKYFNPQEAELGFESDFKMLQHLGKSVQFDKQVAETFQKLTPEMDDLIKGLPAFEQFKGNFKKMLKSHSASVCERLYGKQ